MNQDRVETLQALLRADPDDGFALYALGLEHLASDPARACALWGQLLGREPQHVPALFQLAQATAESGDLDAARGYAERGIVAARAQGDAHALGEIEDFLDQL